ncbi:unnamed protein product [Prunus armeniaca]|uniref:Uncharacterized protein n=1 Tax=Prunus armeniaca TaxID=36596 RepID=A0A6J5VML8_PRUAR|nr:unnamed protein product [Prunus armeniaca]
MLKLQRTRQGPSSRDDDTTDPALDCLGNHALRPTPCRRQISPPWVPCRTAPAARIPSSWQLTQSPAPACRSC